MFVCCDCIDVHFLFLWFNRNTLTSKSINYCHNTANRIEAIFLLKHQAHIPYSDKISEGNALYVCLIWYFFFHSVSVVRSSNWPFDHSNFCTSVSRFLLHFSIYTLFIQFTITSVCTIKKVNIVLGTTFLPILVKLS